MNVSKRTLHSQLLTIIVLLVIFSIQSESLSPDLENETIGHSGSDQTNSNIQKKSSKKHRCCDSQSISCYLQNMLNVSRLEEGSPCNKFTKYKTRSSVNSSERKAEDCKSPKGKDCTWYRQCLAVLYPCHGQVNYAIDYGDRMCQQYQKNLAMFSLYGLSWLDAARKCLQVDLARIVYASAKPEYTCAQVKQLAFDTHGPCYLHPDASSTLSVCELSVYDFYAVFTTIKSAFISDFTESIKGLWEIMKGCA